MAWTPLRTTYRKLPAAAPNEPLRLENQRCFPSYAVSRQLTKEQWLSRRRDPRDERSVVISLLPGGRALEARAGHLPAQILAKVGLSLTELATLRTQLTQLLTRLA